MENRPHEYHNNIFSINSNKKTEKNMRNSAARRIDDDFLFIR